MINYSNYVVRAIVWVWVHQFDNRRLGGTNYLPHKVHQNGICRHHPLLRT
jgi:hypothetical protein